MFNNLGGTIPAMSDEHPRRRAPSMSTNEVVDAAERLLDDVGFEGFSVRSLAARLGVSRQVVYTHFDGVDGVFDALHRRATGYLAEAIDRAVGARGSVEHLVDATAAYIRVARSHPHLYRLAFEAPVPDYEPSAATRRAARASFGHVVVAAEAHLRDAVDSVPDDPTTWSPDAIDLARSTWTTAHGYAVLERVGYARPDETDRLVDRSIRALLAGWTA